MTFGVVILAAGASRRMGRPKLLLPWKGRSVLSHLIDQWNTLGAAETAVVVATDDVALGHELEVHHAGKVTRIVNPHPEEGMFSSIRCAALCESWSGRLTHFVVTLGDQPHLKSSTLQRLLQFAKRNEDRICQPSLSGRPKHPIVLPRLWFKKLPSTGAETLKEFLARERDHVSRVEIDDEGLGVDLDTPEDYDNALLRFGG